MAYNSKNIDDYYLKSHFNFKNHNLYSYNLLFINKKLVINIIGSYTKFFTSNNLKN